MKAYKKHQFSYQILSFHSNTKPWKKTAMASLIQCTSPVSHRRITSVLSSHPRCFPQIRNSETLFVVNPSVFSGNGKKPFTNAEFECNSGVSDISDTNKASEINHSKLQQSKAEAIAHSKSKLLRAVSGLKAGLTAGEDDVEKVEFAAKELESICGPVDLSNHLEKLQGKWKLIYSSAFSSRTVGGTRLFRPFVRALPITVSQVFQRIDVSRKEFDNIAEVELGTPWLLPSLELVATFPYKFELTDTSKIKIRSEKSAMIKMVGQSENSPSLELLQIPDSMWPSSFIGTDGF